MTSELLDTKTKKSKSNEILNHIYIYMRNHYIF